ncbi:hypothetical protein BAS09_03790 [Elizabethkingia ursingii]|uniref:helix-turn-helix transcriptional regulator n=1 Tax=Elizabethkingia TaxID=308865 RepID=UPI00099A38E5|nr:MULTISPECIES: hypothetical protein [Elizabethkingia]MCL1670910.1 hypothetical protein [Elizabethkingia ursingii]OPC04820.1 hypothetical protein BAS09_03790 [Elizabethkingia ursingii]PUB26408.1 hypothetical protein C8J95_11192 [Elizabethkingia sp. YR214]
MKKAFIFIFYFFQISIFFCQNTKELQKVDELINSADFYIWKDPLKSLEYAKMASLSAEELKNSSKKSQAYYYIARSLLFYGEFKEANIYIKKGIKEDATKQSYYLIALYGNLNSMYYSRMLLFEKQRIEDTNTLKQLASIDQTQSILLQSINYSALADYYTEINDYKSAHIHADKSISLVEKIPQRDYFLAREAIRYKAYIYYYKAIIYMAQHNASAAYPYIQKAYNQALSEGNLYTTLFLELYGDYYFETKNYQKALDFYLVSFSNKKKFLRNTNTAVALTMKISKTYKILGSKDKEEEYFRLADQYRIFDEKVSQKRIHTLLDNIEQDHITEKASITYKSNIKVTFIVAFFILLFITAIYYQKKQKAITNLKHNIHKNQIIEKEEELLVKNSEIKKLQLQKNDAFNEIIDLAQSNSPHFWVRFQEIYPEFTKNILQVNTNLKASELAFCAYIYLGFTTKEIASYTFKATKTIENNRYNIRKRLKLSPDEDLKLWLTKFIE